MNLNIGSGDVGSLLAGKNTQTYRNLWQKFIGEKPYYNALASPIDALRTGAIIEDRYYDTLPDDYYPQVRAVYKDMDVLSASLDFAKFEKGKISNFEELKTIFAPDFDEFVIQLKNMEYDEYIQVVKKKFKKYYNQVQQQMLCTGLNTCTLVFVAVYSYDDETNYNRIIKDEDVVKLQINWDKEVINKIVERAQIFQLVKDDLR